MRPRGASPKRGQTSRAAEQTAARTSGCVTEQPLRPGPQIAVQVPTAAPAVGAASFPAPAEDPEDYEQTVPEGTTRAELQREFIRISRLQDRREEKLRKQESGLQEQESIIAAAQAEKVLRQSAVDQTQSELRDLKAQAALLAQRIAEAEAYQDDVAAPTPAQVPSATAPTEAQQAADCMRKTLLALKHFAKIEDREIRDMLVEFVHDFR